MSIRAKLAGGCEGLLVVMVGALQMGLMAAVAGSAMQAGRELPIDTDQAFVEVLVVEASRISRG